MENQVKRCEVLIDNDTLEKIKIINPNVSDFIRIAVNNELAGRANSTNEFTGMLKKVDALDTESLMEKVNKLEVTLHILFEEQQKQREMLKIIYRRGTITGQLIQQMYVTEYKAEACREKIDKYTQIVQEEIDKIFNKRSVS